MKLPANIKIFGDVNYRGPCPQEGAEQMTVFNRIRRHPVGALAIHPKNEGKRTKAQMDKDKALGLTTGASDVIIPANPSFICELKRRDHTKSKITQEQIDYLTLAQKHGALVCIALGADAFQEAFDIWLARMGMN